MQLLATMMSRYAKCPQTCSRCTAPSAGACGVASQSESEITTISLKCPSGEYEYPYHHHFIACARALSLSHTHTCVYLSCARGPQNHLCRKYHPTSFSGTFSM